MKLSLVFSVLSFLFPLFDALINTLLNMVIVGTLIQSTK